jgi:ferredoxin-NADP reductase
VPRLTESDLYVCGPDGFTDRVVSAALSLGVPREQIHYESFTF